MVKEIACHLSISIEITSLQGGGGGGQGKASREKKIRGYSAQSILLMSYKEEMES